MFKKKPNVKTLAPLSSSERRRLTDKIIFDYQSRVSEWRMDHEQENQANSSSDIGTLRNSLLPDGSSWAKFSTTVGPDLQTVTGTVYVGAYPGEDQRILWFKVDEKICPTVYSLWRHPRLLPLLHTHDAVLRKMRDGANLMTPGLARGPPFPAGSTKGSTVAIASLEKPTVPVAVGVCVIDISSLREVQGRKGHAVQSLHWAGDEIWGWSQVGNPGGSAPEQLEGWASEPDFEMCNLEKVVPEMTLHGSNPDSVASNTCRADSITYDKPAGYSGVDKEEGTPFEKVSISKMEMSTEDVDKAFRGAFLYAMHHWSTDPQNARYALEFPIPQSLFISKLILPFLPIFNAGDAAALQLKKTSWKTPKKFVKSLEKESLLRSKDRGPETVIQNVAFEDAAIKTFLPYQLPKAKPTKEGAFVRDNKSMPSGGAFQDGSIGQRLSKMILLRPKEKLAPILEAGQVSVRSLYLSAELRSVITRYIESENLVSANQRLVDINPIIANSVFDGRFPLDRKVLDKGTVLRDVLIDRVIQSCAPYWVVLRNDETRDDAKPKAGTPPTIRILVETRSGNKTVTKVSGVEAFFINPQPLADELQKACASSTSVSQLVGSSPKAPVMEIMVQGPQKDTVARALERRGVNKSWIEVLDKTKGKKR